MLNLYPQYVFKDYGDSSTLYKYSYYMEEIFEEILNNNHISNINPNNFDKKLKTILAFM
jgi:hypothetical protein